MKWYFNEIKLFSFLPFCSCNLVHFQLEWRKSNRYVIRCEWCGENFSPLCLIEQSRESKNFNLAHAWAEPTWLSNNTFPTLWKKEKTCLFFSQSISQIVKRVSCFKSSLLLRIQIKYTHELHFLIKTKESIFNRKLYTTDERRKPSMAWLEFLRQTLS